MLRLKIHPRLLGLVHHQSRKIRWSVAEQRPRKPTESEPLRPGCRRRAPRGPGPAQQRLPPTPGQLWRHLGMAHGITGQIEGEVWVRYQEEIHCCEGGEVLEEAAQGGLWVPHPWQFQSQAGRGSEQSGLAGGVGSRWSSRSVPTP